MNMLSDSSAAASVLSKTSAADPRPNSVIRDRRLHETYSSKMQAKQGVAAQSLRESAQSKRTRTCQLPTREFMPQTIWSRLIFPRRRGAGTGNVVSTFIKSGLHEADCSQFDKDGPDHFFETSQHVLQKGQVHCVFANKYGVPVTVALKLR